MLLIFPKKIEQRRFKQVRKTTLKIMLAALATFLFIVSANAAGEVDPGFTPTIQLDPGSIAESIVQSDGKIVSGGIFNIADGKDRNGLVRFNADGSV